MLAVSYAMVLRLLNSLVADYLRLLGVRRRVLEHGPVSLAFYDAGPRDAEPWVLVHGLGSIAASWLPVLKSLRRECRLLAPEMSSLGGTRCPGGGLGIGPAMEMLRELIDRELGGRPVTLVGLSLGGWMSVRFALRHPEKVARLVLIDAGGYRDQDWDHIQSLVMVNDLAGVDRLYTALFAQVPWSMRISRSAFLAAYTSPGVKHVLDTLTEDDTFQDEDLAQLYMPTGVIWGEHDGLFTVETGRRIAAALPHPHLEVIRGCGHATHMECPGELVAALRRFRRATASGNPAPEPLPTLASREV